MASSTPTLRRRSGHLTIFCAKFTGQMTYGRREDQYQRTLTEHAALFNVNGDDRLGSEDSPQHRYHRHGYCKILSPLHRVPKRRDPPRRHRIVGDDASATLSLEPAASQGSSSHQRFAASAFPNESSAAAWARLSSGVSGSPHPPPAPALPLSRPTRRPSPTRTAPPVPLTGSVRALSLSSSPRRAVTSPRGPVALAGHGPPPHGDGLQLRCAARAARGAASGPQAASRRRTPPSPAAGGREGCRSLAQRAPSPLRSGDVAGGASVALRPASPDRCPVGPAERRNCDGAAGGAEAGARAGCVPTWWEAAALRGKVREMHGAAV
eukprot:gene8345-6022_t